jgi:hypothetical protein
MLDHRTLGVLVLGLAVLAVLAGPVWAASDTPAQPAGAGPFEDGLRAYERGDYAEAIRWWHKAAAQGHVNAQFHLGIMYYGGHGVAQSYTEAVRWFRQAAELGFARAQFNLDAMHAEVQGVPQDYAEAIRWYPVKRPSRGMPTPSTTLALYTTRGRESLWTVLRPCAGGAKPLSKAMPKPS